MLFVVGAVYYFVYGKNQLVATAADEELALVLAAESYLDDESEETKAANLAQA